MNALPRTSQGILGDADCEDVTAEQDEDPSLLVRTDLGNTQSTNSYVNFTILLSPTYGVPVLWFTFHNLPSRAVAGIEDAYQYLVAASAEHQLKDIGVIGGISIANHPQTDVPAYFIHPCNTHNALMDFAAKVGSPEQYLLIWLGLVGSSVGLYVPSQLLSS